MAGSNCPGDYDSLKWAVKKEKKGQKRNKLIKGSRLTLFNVVPKSYENTRGVIHIRNENVDFKWLRYDSNHNFSNQQEPYKIA